jgi:K+-transporting ATPase ATPase A chain
MLAAVMLVGRFAPMLLVLVLAGSLASQPRLEQTAGTLRTDGLLFTSLLVGTAVVVTLITYAPALALGPLAEALP